MNKGKILSLGLIILGVVLLVFYFTTQNKTEEKKEAKTIQKLKVSTNFAEAREYSLLLDIAEDRGYLKDNGIEVERIDSRTNTQLLLAGESEASIPIVASIVDSFLNNKDFKCLSVISNFPSNWYVVSRIPMDKLSEVKKIGVQKIGNADHISAELFAEKFGIKNPEYVVSADAQVKAAMLAKGDIDLAFILTQEAYKKLKENKNLYFMNPDEAFKDIYLPKGVVTTKKSLEKKPEAIKGLVKAIYQAIIYEEQNKDATISFIKSKYKLSEEDAKSLYEEITKSRVNLNYVPEKEAFSKLVQMMADILKPANPKRNLDEFIFKDYALEAIGK